MKTHAEWRWERKEQKDEGTQAIIRWARTQAPLGFYVNEIPENLFGPLTYSQVRHNLLKMRSMKFIELDCGKLKRIRILAEGTDGLESKMFASAREAESEGFSRRLVNEALAGTHRRGKVYAGYRWHYIHEPMKGNVEMKYKQTINSVKAYLYDLSGTESAVKADIQNRLFSLPKTQELINKLGVPPTFSPEINVILYTSVPIQREMNRKIKVMIARANEGWFDKKTTLMAPPNDWFQAQALAHFAMLRTYCEAAIYILETE